MRIPAPPAEDVRLNLSPLIDVIFILLVFVVLVARFIDLNRIDVDLPSSAAGIPETKLALVVDLPDDGTIHIEDQLIEASAIRAALRERRHRHDRVVVRADKDIPLHRAVLVLSAAKLEGYDAAAIATEELTAEELRP